MGVHNISNPYQVMTILFFFLLVGVLVYFSEYFQGIKVRTPVYLNYTCETSRLKHNLSYITRNSGLTISTTHRRENSRLSCTGGRWPRLQLFLTMPESMYGEFQSQLWQSAMLFWPRSELNLTIVLDKEANNIRNFADKLMSDLSPYCRIDVRYNEVLPYYKIGHDRQQFVMFWADNFTDSKFVGFVDTDTVFNSPIQLEDIFENDKPTIIGLFGAPQNQWWAQVPTKTHFALQKLEVLRCMAYFPVVINTQHLREMRAYMEKIHGTSFNQLFQNIWSRGPYSQFNIICNYLWYFHRDEYVWYVQEFVHDWKGAPPGGQIPNNLSAAGILPDMLFPKPRIAVHWGYRSIGENSLEEVLRLGKYFACAALNSSSEVQLNQSTCNYNLEHFRFEWYSWTWHQDLCKAFRERQTRQGICWSKIHLSQMCLNLVQ